MGGKLLVHFDSPETAAQIVQRFSRTASKRTTLREVGNYVNGLQSGARRAHVRVQCFEAFATQTVACSASGGAPNDTLVVGSVTLTNAASPANENQFADAATDALLAASVAAAINAHSILSLFVKASSSSGTLTITSLYGGPVGDAIPLAETGNGFTLGGTFLDGGDATLDESQTFEFGYDGT
jgi:hypothetical protein